MKKLELITKLGAVLVLVLFVNLSCSTQDNPENIDLTKDEKLKNEVFDQIMQNEQLFNEFMNKMMNDPQSLRMMMNHQHFVHDMFSETNLNYMMQHHAMADSLMMHNMWNIMSNDSVMRYRWEHMMDQGMHGGMMHH